MVKALTTLGFLLFAVIFAPVHAQSKNLPFTSTPIFNANKDTQSVLEMKDLAGFADEEELKKYFSISSVSVTPITSEYVFDNFANKQDKALGEIIMVVDQLIALGKKIWPIVQAGRPVINTQFSPALSVLPRTNDAPDMVAMYQMSNWQSPTQKSYLIEYKNGFGSTVISFTYSVSFQYGGKYEGKGLYLTGLDVSASNIRVSWGFEFDATSALINISNSGTMEDPIATATVRIDYKSKSFFNAIHASEAFHVRGDGSLTKVF